MAFSQLDPQLTITAKLLVLVLAAQIPWQQRERALDDQLEIHALEKQLEVNESTILRMQELARGSQGRVQAERFIEMLSVQVGAEKKLKDRFNRSIPRTNPKVLAGQLDLISSWEDHLNKAASSELRLARGQQLNKLFKQRQTLWDTLPEGDRALEGEKQSTVIDGLLALIRSRQVAIMAQQITQIELTDISSYEELLEDLALCGEAWTKAHGVALESLQKDHWNILNAVRDQEIRALDGEKMDRGTSLSSHLMKGVELLGLIAACRELCLSAQNPKHPPVFRGPPN